MVHEVKEVGYYSCVTRNINVFKHLSNTLSVVDATILCPLPLSLAGVFHEYLLKQVTNLGFGKKVFGTLEIVSVNSLDVEYSCDSTITKQSVLPAKLYPQDGEVVSVILQGAVVDSVLGFSGPFLQLFDQSLVELKSSLLNFKKGGWFTIDKAGQVTAFKGA
ncbi:hypothetical protein GOP47_0031098 [Adiantum capillus-veneris]|nr:hypothetical protein GOP47_0031098 [Adiantum capillus-veneris]